MTINLATLLRQAREESGLSIRALADKSGVGKSSIARWERGSCLPSIPELELVLSTLDFSHQAAHEAFALIPRPRAWSLTPSYDFSSDLLRALRYRAGISSEQAAERLGVSKSTVSKWESGDRYPDAESLLRIAALLEASESELEALQRGNRYEESDCDFEARLQGLLRSVRQGSQEPLDLEFLSLEAAIRRKARSDAELTESIANVRAAYVEWLGWWYRDREADVWANRQLCQMHAIPNLPIWGRLIRARNVHFSECGPKEPSIRIRILRESLGTLTNTPNEAFIRRELAAELIGLGYLKEALEQIERSRRSKKLSEAPATHHFCCNMVESAAWLSVGNVDRAANLLSECPPNDPYLKVSSTVGRSQILVAMGETDRAKRELKAVFAQSIQDGYQHFARTARMALERLDGQEPKVPAGV